MQRLFLFIYKYRAILLFLLLEIVCIWLLVSNNNYQSAKYLNSANSLTGSLLTTTGEVKDYFHLSEANAALAAENARLKKRLEQYRLTIYDSSSRIVQIDDSVLLDKYTFTAAKVIKNSVRMFRNYITINKGSKHGIARDMAIVGNDGAVGKVKNVSQNFSVITSLLHTDVLVSSKVKRTGDLCTTQWDGRESAVGKLNYLPRHVILQRGDTIVTSGYNAVFPEGIPIGVVESISLSEDALFYDARIRFATDFNSLEFIYVVKNNLLSEQDSIESITIMP